MRFFRLLCIVTFSGLYVLSAQGQNIASGKVVASIAPISFLVAGVMDGVGKPSLLFQATQSHHGASLRPSQARLLNNASIVFYVDAGIKETIKSRLTGPNQHLISLLDTPNLLKYKRRTDVIDAFDDEHRDDNHHEEEHASDDEHKDEHNDDYEEEHASDDEHARSGHVHVGIHDPHIWLSAHNAIAMTQSIAYHLALIYPQHAETFFRNLKRMTAQLKPLTSKLKKRLSPVHDVAFMVYHDAYQYFAKSYDINIVGALTVEPGLPLSARQMHKVRTRLKQAHVACVLREPQFNAGAVEALIDNKNIALGVADPLGKGLPVAFTSYGKLLFNIADALVNCANS